MKAKENAPNGCETYKINIIHISIPQSYWQIHISIVINYQLLWLLIYSYIDSYKVYLNTTLNSQNYCENVTSRITCIMASYFQLSLLIFSHATSNIFVFWQILYDMYIFITLSTSLLCIIMMRGAFACVSPSSLSFETNFLGLLNP